MMLRVAWRSLMTRPVRTAVLAAGFGFGVAVMAELLGVGHVILEQARSPELNGGGDLVVFGPFGAVPSARFITASVLGTPDVAPRVTAASPSKQAKLFLMTPRGAVPVSAKGGVPSLERSVGDPEVSRVASWVDGPGDARWSRPSPQDILRTMDRFHPSPDVPARASSWAEWLYFNARTRDGRVRLYLTFLVGPRAADPSRRLAGVRLQLERNGRSSTYSAQGDVDEASVLEHAPDLDIAGNRVRLDGAYRLTLALNPKLTGELILEPAAGRSLPPAVIRGAGGWVSGYVVPVLSGVMRGTLNVGGESVTFDDAAGYHDHNWGFWQGVSWQWGQVAHDDLSIVYGRVFPPADVADPSRVQGFLAVLGANGPLGFSTEVTIDDGQAGRVDVQASDHGLRLRLTMTADEVVRTQMGLMRAPGSQPMDFLQLGGQYIVNGAVNGRSIDFRARGSAETFKPH